MGHGTPSANIKQVRLQHPVFSLPSIPVGAPPAAPKAWHTSRSECNTAIRMRRAIYPRNTSATAEQSGSMLDGVMAATLMRPDATI